MRTVALASMVLAMPVAALAFNMPDEWNICTAKADCIAIYGTCSSVWLSVNKVHEVQAKQKMAENMAMIKCSWPPPKLKPAILDCETGKCVVRNPNGD